MGGQQSTGRDNHLSNAAVHNPSRQRIISLRGSTQGNFSQWSENSLQRMRNETHRIPALSVYRTTAVENPANLQKKSLCLVPSPTGSTVSREWQLFFEFHASAPTDVRVILAAVDTKDSNGTETYESLDGAHELASGQQFAQGADHTFKSVPFDPRAVESTRAAHGDAYSVVIQLRVALNSGTVTRQDTIAAFIESADDHWIIAGISQRIIYKGRTYDVQEIYGLDQSLGDEAINPTSGSAMISGRECVICLSEKRTTTVLPCRHLCLCAACAGIMRVQTNKCPICRQPVASLLQIAPGA